jgi:tRNA(Ile)-lysidine synthase
VSGGPDSLALALLAREWVASRGGQVLALVLDHGVRQAAATEAALAEAWLAARGIVVRRLALRPAGPRPAEALRAERLAALADAAAEAGCLHLLLAHHRGDQAETVLVRRLRGSHAGGLAAMAPSRPAGRVRLVRPLLGVSPGALRDALRSAGQPWIVDPSNAAGSVRARLRAALADQAGEGVGVRALAEVAAAAAVARAAAARARDRLLAEAVALLPQGCARLDVARLVAADDTTATAVLAALLRAIGGHAQPVRTARVEALLARLRNGAAGTAAGCLLRPGRGAWLVCREPAAVAGPAIVPPDGRLRWDGRWQVEAPPGLTVGALGGEAAALARADRHARAWPRVVLVTLPALRDGATLVAVPPIGYDAGRFGGTMRAVFRPPQPVAASATGRVAASGGPALAPGSAIPS